MRICLIRRVAVALGLGGVGWLLFTAPVRAGEIETKAQICASCHGASGVPSDPAIPVIWGQNEGYLYLQLRDIKRGVRKVEVMGPILEPLEKSDLQALAAYFSTRSWPRSCPAEFVGCRRTQRVTGECLGRLHRLPLRRL